MSYNKVSNSKLTHVLESLTRSKCYYSKILDDIQEDSFQQKEAIFYNKDTSFNGLSLLKILDKIKKNHKGNRYNDSYSVHVKNHKPIASKPLASKPLASKQPEYKKSDISKSSDRIIGEIKKSKINEKTYNGVNDYFTSEFYINLNNKIDINVFDKYQNMKIISNEPVLMAVCILIYDKFLLLSDDKKMIFIKELKYKMSIDLDKKDLYKKFNYNHKRFRKADFQGELIENKILNNEHFYRYLGDYFDINFIIYENSLNYINNYNSNRYSVILQKSNDNYYVHYNLDSLSIVNDSYIKSINNIDTFNSNFGTLGKDLTKNKLGELQNIAKGLNINTMKHGRCNLINKTKKELIYEITKIDR